MENVIKRFERLKNTLLMQGASVMGEAMTNAFAAALEEYQSVVAVLVEKENIRLKDIKSQNDLLRGLIGLSDEELKMQLIRQGEEIRFLHAQSLEMKKAVENKSKENDDLRLQLEQSKNDVIHSLNEREQERITHEKSLKQLGAQLKEFENKTAQKRQLILSRLQENCNVIISKAQTCSERINNIKAMPFFEKLSKEESEMITGNIPDIELISDNCKKINQAE